MPLSLETNLNLRGEQADICKLLKILFFDLSGTSDTVSMEVLVLEKAGKLCQG